VKFRKLSQFDSDYKRLSESEKAAFKAVIRDVFNPACDRYAVERAKFAWPKSLRFEHLTGTNGVCAITWSFSGPDGRATFEFEDVDGEIRIVWRRVGRHTIYKKP
jgi:hypothetical protein